eukprot:999121-Amphidinium_carterae.1
MGKASARTGSATAAHGKQSRARHACSFKRRERWPLRRMCFSESVAAALVHVRAVAVLTAFDASLGALGDS